MTASLLIYGATGYTGQLIARHAAMEGLRPIVAGRNGQKVGTLAGELGLEGRTFTLHDEGTIARHLEGVDCVLNVAGPFSQTARPVIDACLQTGTHYLDVTGEIEVFELAASRDAAARAAGIMLLPGVGFDVVPSDCLAAMVTAELAEPVSLEIGILGLGGASQGTMKTGVESIGAPTRVRRAGKIVSRPAGSLTRHFDFGRGPRPVVAVSWGDVATAYYSTGVPNITDYFPARSMSPLLRAARWLGPVLRTRPVQAVLKRAIELRPAGPNEEKLETAISIVVAEAKDANGGSASGRLQTPNGYKLTYLAAVDIARRVLGGAWKAGFQTPSLAYGAEYVLTLPGCRLEKTGETC
ncbi:MAG: saccharopine dehydrogenase NADP-binding domain-containing protein [Anaerolineae bacterium]|nr:saccharopine dehydrogenase NADP-binding domain-containing protein [Anaerolineae bacterium]